MGLFYVVADQGMINAKTLEDLDQRQIPYIPVTRRYKVNEIKDQVLSHLGRYWQVLHESSIAKNPSPLKIKEVVPEGKRYIIRLNPRQAIVESLEEKIKTNPKGLIGNREYRQYLRMDRESVSIDQGKINYEPRLDGKRVLLIIAIYQQRRLRSSTSNYGKRNRTSEMSSQSWTQGLSTTNVRITSGVKYSAAFSPWC